MAPPHPIWFMLRDDCQLDTALYVGAVAQTLLFLAWPGALAALPAALILVYRAAVAVLMRAGAVPDPLLAKAWMGRSTAQLVDRDGQLPSTGADKQIVVFILGSHTNRASTGRIFVEGGSTLRSHFVDMWTEVGKDPDKWGFLGRTSTLYASEEGSGNITAWISYWRSLEDLQRFAHGPSHTKGLRWWLQQDHSMLGVMHETYVVPARHWETIYHNFRPFGLAQSKQPIQLTKEQKSQGTLGVTNGRFSIKGQAWASMKSRMRAEGFKPVA